MLRKNEDLHPGFNLICDEEKDQMFMHIQLLIGRRGESWPIESEQQETALLLLSGTLTYQYEGKTVTAKRQDLFHDDATCLHVCRKPPVVLTFEEDGEVLIQQKINPQTFPCMLYDKSNIDKQFFGEGKLAATTKRQVTTILDYERTPYSKMVLGEITNFPGIWSSYPPHHHPQPEVYFYKFDHPQGFGSCFMGEDVYKITHNSVAMIPGGLTHPQNAAPGYAMFYVWMIPHLEGNPWIKTRTFDPDHEWVNDENAEFFQLEQ
ncbi:MAG: 5-deoxy-glucuronate isomerase [Holdemania massiliensis]